MTIPLAKKYVNSVVVVKPISYLGADAGVIRIRNVTDDSFDLHLQE